MGEGSSSIGCGGQNSLEAESLQPNSPLGERINDDDYRPLNIHFLYYFDAFIAHSRLNSPLQCLIDMRKCRTISPDVSFCSLFLDLPSAGIFLPLGFVS